MSLDDLKILQDKIIRKNKRINIISIIVTLIILAITLIFILLSNIEALSIYIVLPIELVFSLIIVFIIKNRVNGSDIQNFNNEFKNIFVLKSLQNNFDNLVYRPEKGFSESEINAVGMLDTGDRFFSNDYISGKYKNINFEQSDVHIDEKREVEDDEGNKREVWRVIFRGRWMIFDFNKNFKSNVQVISNGFPANVFPFGKKFKQIQMEDIEFNKKFRIFSEMEHDAFYILTPHFMEKIKNIYKELNCSIMFGFLDNKLYIALNDYKDSFEYDVFKKINEEEIEKNILKDIKIITDFVDELNLNNDIFKKGL